MQCTQTMKQSRRYFPRIYVCTYDDEQIACGTVQCIESGFLYPPRVHGFLFVSRFQPQPSGGSEVEE